MVIAVREPHRASGLNPRAKPDSSTYREMWRNRLHLILTLFAIQYGLDRHSHTTRFARCELRDLRILVIDTKGFPAGTFLRDMEAIEAFPPTCVGEQDLVDWRETSTSENISHRGVFTLKATAYRCPCRH